MGDYLSLMVEDSGRETVRVRVKRSDRAGIGLKNTQERLSVLYDDDYEFNTTDSELGGFKVDIKLPLQFAENNDD